MDGLTRVRHAIERKPLDRVPRFDSFWEDTLTAWRGQGLPADADPDEFFGWDMRMMYLDASMRAEQKLLSEDGEFVVFQDRAGYTVRKMVGKSRALEWLDHVTKDKAAWDTSKDGFAFDPTASARIDTKSYFAHMDPYPAWGEVQHNYDALRATGNAVVYVVYGPWESTWRHRGYEQLMLDMAMDPDWVREMAEAQVELVIEILRHCVHLDMKPDALFLVDDVACNRGLLFSPDMWRAAFRPLYKRLGDFLHTNEIWFWLHCCGNCEALIPDYLDCGLDVLQPLQAHAGMDIRKLKKVFGDDLTFWGNVDVTKLSGAAEACREEVRKKLMAGKAGGGYIYHSDHSIPPEVDFERYQWIMELVAEYGQCAPLDRC